MESQVQGGRGRLLIGFLCAVAVYPARGGPAQRFSDVPSYRQLSDLLAGSSLPVPRLSLGYRFPLGCLLTAAPPCWPSALRLRSGSEPSGGTPPHAAPNSWVPSLARFSFASEPFGVL